MSRRLGSPSHRYVGADHLIYVADGKIVAQESMVVCAATGHIAWTGTVKAIGQPETGAVSVADLIPEFSLWDQFDHPPFSTHRGSAGWVRGQTNHFLVSLTVPSRTLNAPLNWCGRVPPRLE